MSEDVAKCGRFEQTTRADCDRLRVHPIAEATQQRFETRGCSQTWKDLGIVSVLEQRPEGENRRWKKKQEYQHENRQM